MDDSLNKRTEYTYSLTLADTTALVFLDDVLDSVAGKQQRKFVKISFVIHFPSLYVLFSFYTSSVRFCLFCSYTMI